MLEALRDDDRAGARGEQPAFARPPSEFLDHAHEAINPSLTEADVREMLIQHILTEEIFSKVFGEHDFHRQNNVAKELYELEATFFTGDLKKQTLQGPGPLLRRHPRRRRADQQPPREADLPQGHLRELLQGLQPQGRRPAGRGLHAERDRALHDRGRRLAVREALRPQPDRHATWRSSTRPPAPAPSSASCWSTSAASRRS